MRGVYQHCDEKHLHRYLAEFDFRYSNRVVLGIGDESCAAAILDGIVGKPLTYIKRLVEREKPIRTKKLSKYGPEGRI